jgi:hypothetical protein
VLLEDECKEFRGELEEIVLIVVDLLELLVDEVIKTLLLYILEGESP